MESLVVAVLFAPLSWLYRLGTRLDRFFTRAHRLAYPVVSVGNIALGGRAKTPFVIYLCDKLKLAGFEPVVLTRGYGRSSPGDVRWRAGEQSDPQLLGDEATEIARAGVASAILVGARRAQNAESFLLDQREHHRWVFVLDDGFQHWALERDVDIVLVTREDKVNRVLPWGELRETSKNLERATLVLELGVELVKETIVHESARMQKPLILTTRAGYRPYVQDLKSRFFGAHSVALKDHAGRDAIVKSLTTFPGTDVILGDKEAVKLLTDAEHTLWRQTGVITKRYANVDKKLHRAFLRLTWPNEHRALQMITQKIQARFKNASGAQRD